MDHLLDVRRHVIEELPTTGIVAGLLTGQPDHDAYVRYLTNVAYYAQFSPRVMALAAAPCMSSHPDLANYLLCHAQDEQGHELWALADLADLEVAEADARQARPVPACAALVGYIHYLATYGNPIALFGWMYVLEAVGNDVGSAVAHRLNEWLGGKATRFVEGHGVADIDHTRELTEQIATFVTTEEDRLDVDFAADVVADLYVRMFREVGGERPQWH